MYGIPGFRSRPVKKHIDAGRMTINKSRRFHRRNRPRQIRRSKKDVNVLRISHGGGIDSGEGAMRALHRECLEEIGWRIRVVRRLGAFQRFTYMPEYDLWARKVCHVYLAHPVRRVGEPVEPGHRAVWMSIPAALGLLAIEGDRAFLERVWRLGG